MQCPSCRREVRIGSIYCHYCGEPLENIFRQELENPKLVQSISAGDEGTIPEAPVCVHCGRQDDTLRIVVYPFVVSVIVVTYRRDFRGLMCKKHQNLYLVLASAITAMIGWIGIPFGIVFTPVALFQLACGGNQPKDSNFRMLKSLAKHKYDQGDSAGAIKCLEASLQFEDNVEIRREIKQYRLRMFTPENETGARTKISSTIALLLGSALIGASIGILDYVFTQVFSLVFQGDILIYWALLSWAPFVAMAFIGGLALYQLIEWVIARTSLRNSFVAVAISGLSALVAAYSIAQGQAISDYVYYLLRGGVFESVIDAIITGGIVSVIGGFLWMLIDEPSTSDIIFLVLMAVILVYYLIMAIRAAIKSVQWQKRITVEDSVAFD